MTGTRDSLGAMIGDLAGTSAIRRRMWQRTRLLWFTLAVFSQQTATSVFPLLSNRWYTFGD